jgi:hypothetical protein
MCALILPPSVNPITINRYINDTATLYNLQLEAHDTDARFVEALKSERGGGRDLAPAHFIHL